jgi:hypothetical protein
MKIYKLSQMDCGGFGPAKGHLDTQTFPDCPDRSLSKQKDKKKKNKCENCKKADTDFVIKEI